MALRDFQGVFEDLRGRLGNKVGSRRGAERWYGPGVKPRASRRRALALVAIVILAVGAAGYAIGASKGVEVGPAELAGMAAGEQEGIAAGGRAGYESGFEPARERAYDAAYRKAYRAAYRDEFDQADLAAPSSVPVRGS